MPKGKGKGDYNQPPSAGKDGGKGEGKDPIFWGKCKGCGKIGHSINRCPYQGKGFKGNCNACGTIGHTAATCPVYPKGKGKGSGSINELEWGSEYNDALNEGKGAMEQAQINGEEQSSIHTQGEGGDKPLMCMAMGNETSDGGDDGFRFQRGRAERRRQAKANCDEFGVQSMVHQWENMKKCGNACLMGAGK